MVSEWVGSHDSHIYSFTGGDIDKPDDVKEIFVGAYFGTIPEGSLINDAFADSGGSEQAESFLMFFLGGGVNL